jgi:hypothetical protein
MCNIGTCSINPALIQILFFLFLEIGRDSVHLVRRPLIGLLYQPRMIDQHGAFGGMNIVRGNRSTRRKHAAMPLCPPQIPHDLTLDRNRVAALEDRRLTAWDMTLPWYYHVCEWLQTGFGMAIGLIEHLQTVTTSNYSAVANSHTLQFTTARDLLCLHQSLPGSGFQRRTFSLLWVPELSPCLCYSFCVHALTGRRLSPKYWTHNFTHLKWTNSTVCPLITSRRGPHRIHCPSVTVSIVACAAFGTDRTEYSTSRLVHWCVLGICCVATGVVYNHYLATYLSATILV